MISTTIRIHTLINSFTDIQEAIKKMGMRIYFWIQKNYNLHKSNFKKVIKEKLPMYIFIKVV